MKKFSLVFFITAILICTFYSLLNDEEYVVKIGKEHIKSDEYMAYFLIAQQKNEDKSEEEIKQIAVKDCISVYASMRYAKKNGINLDENEEKEVRERASSFERNENFEILKKVCHNIGIYEKVYNCVTNNFEYSEKDFEAMFSEYYKNNKMELNDVYIKYIFINSDKNGLAYAEDVYGKALSGYSFGKLAMQYSDENVYEAIDVEKGGFDKAIVDEAFNLSDEEMTMIETDKGFYIIKIDEIKTPNIKELKEKVLKEYIAERKNQIYEQQIDKWLEKDTIEKNEDFITRL